MDKSYIRKTILNKRRQLSDYERLYASDLICNRVVSSEQFIQADSVLIYADYNYEVATDRIINYALLQSKKVFVPVCYEDSLMNFYRIFSIDELYPGRYGIREPIVFDNLIFSDSELNESTLCIVPGVAFTVSGERLGYGKGFYDRYFERFPIQNRIGICYKCQIVEKLPTDEHDVLMTSVIYD